MQESQHASCPVTAGSPLGRSNSATASQRPSSRRIVDANRVELHNLLSRCRELSELVAGARRENDVLRVHVERSAAALDARGDASDVSRALSKHADDVRKLHEDMRKYKTCERSAERMLKQKVRTTYFDFFCVMLSAAFAVVRRLSVCLSGWCLSRSRIV